MIDALSDRDRIEQLERERDKAEAEARYWRDAWFTHVQAEHPEIVERMMRRIAEGEA